ncbi:hypothetical protein HBI56_015270 [Parastagonospora nodorum]|nr:hypothetical protein HBI09_014120 [Parastagonospora nodorum]KAH4058637.1 hypothetical protein HBH49_035780 [Parastagonospora nodorum]KAH4069298.1 hypothetical protein HBH50_111400 [Parastagonospora nodorum]KAH4088368.1 hypothetical protein HBH48_128370 [Parastagonospora nodorum]KAH4103647.1 hypothetical protein HBH46_110320 [Parastagonospora nodorum]
MANANNLNDSFQAAFETAIHKFRVELKNDNLYREILQTRTIVEVYDVTDKLQEEQSRTGRLRHLSKIEPFLAGLRGYVNVIEVFMQAKSDVLALIWGPIKLLLQWADVLKQSMDAIVDTIAEIGILIPEFQISSELFGEKAAVRDVLLLFFGDILDFYVIALKFFGNTRLKFVFEALWPRQRDKIKIVAGHFQRHTQVLRNEVRLKHIQAEYDFRRQALESFDKFENSHRLQEYQSLRTSMPMGKYEEKLQYLDDRSYHDAGIWLMKHTEFCSWIDRSPGSNPVLWLQGIPGSGKTHLAATVVHEARKRAHSLFAFLTYTHSTNISALSILHSLVFQLSADNPTLQSILCQSSGENFRHNIEAAKSVFKTVASSAGTLYITLDGLDEIEKAPRSKILESLLQFSSEIDGLRLLISCRAEGDITSTLKGKCSSIRIDEHNTEGIHTFITQHTSKWYNERDFCPEVRKEIGSLLAPLADKAKGMFLYAKIVLETIESMDPEEILEDLEILPNTLNEAYGRILLRINQQRHIEREKARSIIGWIGVSPTPLTIHELEQALRVKSRGIGGIAIVNAKVPIDCICGPIIEVVDGYVQFVHFTVQEYFMSSDISTAIDPKEARLGLATCCITYLCQNHYDRSMEPAKMSELILTGAYRFHNFATLYWLNLVEQVFTRYSTDALPIEFINLLETLRGKRETAPDRNFEDSSVPHYMIQLRQRNPELVTMICKSISFQATSEKSSFRTKDIEWASLDPLNISTTSYDVHSLMEHFLTPSQITRPTIKEKLVYHYGDRLFKCQYMSCIFRRHGFETKASRNSHEKEHVKPWKCDVEGCEFENGGFLSRKMRDEHLMRFHAHYNVIPNSEFQNLDEADLKEVCLDLVKADDVLRVRELAAAGMLKDKPHMHDLIPCAAQYASPEMLKMLLGQKCPWSGIYTYWGIYSKLLLCEVVASKSLQMLEYILHSDPADWKKLLNVESNGRVGFDLSNRALEEKLREMRAAGLPDVLAKGNDEMLAILCKWIERDVLLEKTKSYLVYPNMVAATAGDTYREQKLLGMWRKIPSEYWAKNNWKNAITSVASTTCSIELAKFLVNQGVPVDWRNSKAVPTPLLHAARKTNAEAAELVKFLLLSGAEPVVQIVKNDDKWHRARGTVEMSQIHISEQKGAQQISRWLGVSFDQLVVQAKKARGEPESSDT